jgi:putative hydrolase of the HAD superfamily
MPALEAVAFDLYGTLLAVDDPLLRRLPALLGVPARRWLDLVRRELLTTAFPGTRELAEFACRSLVGDPAPEVIAACVAAVEDGLASARPLDGVVALLQFLKRRGLKLGLVSNVSSAHKAPVGRLGLDALFDAMLFSCDEGRRKPDPEIYRELCRRLGVEPGRVLMVGDSLANDVLAPAAIGMRALRVGGPPAGDALRETADLAWLALDERQPLRPLLARGRALPVGGSRSTVTALRPVSGDAQGRYNLVYEVEAAAEGPDEPGAPAGVLFAKRYLAPESAWVEDLAYQVQGLAGLPTCATWVAEGPEPFLLVARAPGAKYGGELDPAVAYELGRHFAFGYIFSNADMRPRNAFLARDPEGRPAITMVDLEHCFFNLAIDVANLPDPTDPGAIDALGPAALLGLVKKRVLTDRTLPRARGEFFDARSAPPEVVRAYGEGFTAAYRTLARRADALCDLVRSRIARAPVLIIGTRAYRRAMASVDVEDIRSRLDADPAPVLDQLLVRRA